MRPISFVLDDPVTQKIAAFTLNIRPEELTRTETSRMSVNQTLGDKTPAWVDSFGPGLPTINIAGHTGWRGANGFDGMAIFEQLHKICFADLHDKRRIAAQKGIDPNKVSLIFADALDHFSWVVVPLPNSFVLRRSRSRPLLMQYNIALQVVDTNIDNVNKILSAFSSSKDLLSAFGLDSLSASLKTIQEVAGEIAGFIDGTLGKASAAFLSMAGNVLNVVSAVVSSVKGSIDTVTGSLLSVARNVMMAGRYLMASVSQVMGLISYAEYRVQQVMGAFSNVICLLTNVFTSGISLGNYSAWYGSSNCSSTSGGSPLSPLSGQNPFALLNQSASTSVGSITTSTDAGSLLKTYAYADPVTQPGTDAAVLGSDMSRIAAGVNATKQLATVPMTP
jgi:hypothetical protein